MRVLAHLHNRLRQKNGAAALKWRARLVLVRGTAFRLGGESKMVCAAFLSRIVLPCMLHHAFMGHLLNLSLHIRAS